MTLEQKLLIIQPDGPQGSKMGLNIGSEGQMKAFDEAVGALPEAERRNLNTLSKVAESLNIQIVKP